MITCSSVLHLLPFWWTFFWIRKYWTITELEHSPKDSPWFCAGFGLLAPWLQPKNCAPWHQIQQHSSWWEHGASRLWFWSCEAFGRWRCPSYHSCCWHIRLFGTGYVFKVIRSLKFVKRLSLDFDISWCLKRGKFPRYTIVDKITKCHWIIQ